MNMWLTVLFRKGTESSRKLFRAADGGRRHSLSPSLSFAAQRSQADDDAHGHGSAYVTLSLILQRFVVWLANRRTFHGCLQQTGSFGQNVMCEFRGNTLNIFTPNSL